MNEQIYEQQAKLIERVQKYLYEPNVSLDELSKIALDL